MDEEAYLLNLLNLKTSLRNCLSQTLLAVGNTLKGSITLCFPVSIHFPKHLLLASVGVTRPDGPQVSQLGIFRTDKAEQAVLCCLAGSVSPNPKAFVNKSLAMSLAVSEN